MKDTLTSLLTLAIMVVGLALIIGGPRAVHFLFAPFISGIRQLLRVLFVALIILVLVSAAMNAIRPHTPSTPEDVVASQGNVIHSDTRHIDNGEMRAGH